MKMEITKAAGVGVSVGLTVDVGVVVRIHAPDITNDKAVECLLNLTHALVERCEGEETADYAVTNLAYAMENHISGGAR